MGGGALQCIVWLWIWMWFWGINIPNCYGSGTTRARGAPHGWFAPHGDGREGVFGFPPSNGSLVGAPRQWRFVRTGLPFGPNLVSAHAHRMPLRHSGVPCNTFTAHPAAPLGSRAAKRRPLSFALYHPPLPSHPQVCGGEKRASPLQACVKCVFGVFQGGLWVALCRGCVISGDAKVQRYRLSRQCPPGWSGVLSPLHPSWATNAAAHRAAFCRLVCPVRVHSCVRLNQHQQTPTKERNKP